MRTACPNCREVYDIEDQHATTEVTCPDCGHPFVPADLPPPAPPAFVPPPVQEPAHAGAATPRLQAVEQVAPTETAPRSSFSLIGTIANVVFGVLFVIGLVFLASGTGRGMELQTLSGLGLTVSSLFALTLFNYLKLILDELRRR